MTNVFTPKYEEFVSFVASELLEERPLKRIMLEKIAAKSEIDNKNLVKELTELGIVRVARQIALSDGLLLDKFHKIINVYNNQANLSMRTSQSILLQQYSTPAPISFIASNYILQQKEDVTYFEPSAGNGLLTIALPPQKIYVNEIDDVRLMNLKTQPFHTTISRNAILPFTDFYKKFDGVITNPPFGTLGYKVDYDSFPISTLDHLMALRALDCMKDTGKAAIIIGGHTTWDDKGSIQAGKNRIFFNYLYSHYYIEDVCNVNGHNLYSRQGTAFDVRLIFINGRKTPSDKNYAPLYNPAKDIEVTEFQQLYDRLYQKKNTDFLKLKIEKAKLKLSEI